MQLSDFDFDLPESLIALRPVRPRPAARMLVAAGEATHDAHVADLIRWLRPGDVLVLNDTQVIPARLTGERRRGGAPGEGTSRIEATLLRRLDDAEWEALARPAKRLREGDIITFGALGAQVAAKGEAGAVTLRFDRAGADLDAAIAGAGAMPLPPYIATRRAPDEADREAYQTVFAKKPGAVAAPTASLHFDDELLAALEAMGVILVRITLHVGAGTFLPVKADDVSAHRMHAEWGAISDDAATRINEARAAGGRVVAAGTTALRLLEAAAPDGVLRPFRGETDIFIRPGHAFRVVDILMTNFHLPRSTLFMLVSAFMGQERMQALYAHAIECRYRFYSYGDSSLLIRGPKPAAG